MLKFFLIVIGVSLYLLGAFEMHVQEHPVHDFFAAAKTYPPIESPLHNNATGMAMAHRRSR